MSRDQLPNMLIIGAPKAGTTSLHAYVAQHPEISMSDPKELRYFWREDWRGRLHWYSGHFDPAKPVRGESTPAYAMWPNRDNVPERAVELIPDARLVYVVRDPIERMTSHWRQRVADGVAKPFQRYMQELELPENPIVCASRYATQLERWLLYYDSARILVLDSDRLREEREVVLAEVFAFLGLAPPEASLDLRAELNTRADKRALRPWGRRLQRSGLWSAARSLPDGLKSPIRDRFVGRLYRPVHEEAEVDDALRARLEDYFRPEVERLRRITGQAFAGWSL